MRWVLPVVTALVTPGCTIFAPPAQPAYMCGMMLPTAMLISLSRYWRLTWMGMPSGVTPMSTKSSGFCERFPTVTRLNTASPTRAINSSQFMRRCVPSATMTEMSPSATPAALSSSRRMGRIKACGVLRVPSSTKMRVRFPCLSTNSLSDGEPIGFRMADLTASAKSATGGACFGPSTHARFSSGTAIVLDSCP